MALCDLGPTILFRRDSSYSPLENTEIALLELQKEFIHVLEYATQSLRLILGIGISVPGPVDADSCTILAHPTFETSLLRSSVLLTRIRPSYFYDARCRCRLPA